MSEKVFHIDQECFVIYVDDVKDKKDRFLRIGNSDHILSINTQVKLISLLSKLYPGRVDNEVEIFKEAGTNKLIGVKENVNNLLNYLKENGVATNGIVKIFADEKTVDGIKKTTEKEFIKELQKHKELFDHSFASFYEDGNIRIFNKNEVLFDLKKRYKDYKSLHDEITQAAGFFAKYYDASYKKDGIILSGKSLFVFSNDNFGCITSSDKWYKDALRLGINPINLNFLYLNSEIPYDPIWFKIFSSKQESDKKTKLIFKDSIPAWTGLLDKRVVEPAISGNIKIDLNNLSININDNTVEISGSNFKIGFSGNIENNLIVEGSFKNKTIFKAGVEDIQKGSLNIYSYNPVILGDLFTQDDYIYKFWDTIKDKAGEEILKQVKSNDSEYSTSYIPEFKEVNFYSRLFTETARRIIIEAKIDADDEIFNNYRRILENFNGKELNMNNILIEQEIGFNDKKNCVEVRDVLAGTNFINVDDSVNPFLFFNQEMDNKEWEKTQALYSDKFKKNIKDREKEIAIDSKFIEVSRKKRYYSDEFERLKRFIDKTVLEGKRDITLEKIKTEQFETKAEKEISKTIVDESYKKTGKEKEYKEKEFKVSGKGESVEKPKSGWIKKLLIALLGLLLLFLLIGGGYLLFNKISKGQFIVTKQSDNSQDVVIKKTQDNYKNKILSTEKKSYYYKFTMTIYDLIRLTNAIAVKNGYNKMMTEEEKKLLANVKDPDWIYPENTLILPDGNKLTIKNGDTMWKLSENFLIAQLDKHEKEIRDYIEKTKLQEITMDDAKKGFLRIKDESYSIMLRDTIDALLKLENFNEWEPYLEKNKIKVEIGDRH